MKSLFFFLLFPFLFFSQENQTDSISIKKPNPIIFGEFFTGLGGGSNFGGYLGAGFNYQHQKHLFTLRYSEFGAIERKKIKDEGLNFTYLFILPAYIDIEKISEYSLLYGNRYINGNFSFSWSAGLGIVQSQERNYVEDLNEYSNWKSSTDIGIPIELNVKWFKSEKKRFRAYYGIIPIGKKKVAFGRSFGFKFVGNISKNSYFGLGISYGFGTHKEYSEISENP